MQNLDNIRYFTRSFQALQGLRTIPFGLFILLLAPQMLGGKWLGGQGNCSFTLPLFLVVIGLWLAAARYYANHFGKVTPLSNSHQSLWAIGLCAFLVAVIVSENLIYRRWPTFQVSPIEISLVVFYMAVGILGRRIYFTIFGVLLLCTGALPLILHTTVGDSLYGTFGFVFSIVFGFGLIVTGLLDHLRLARAFHHAKEALDGGIS